MRIRAFSFIEAPRCIRLYQGSLMTRTRRRGIKLHSFKLIEAILVSHINVTGFNDHEKQQYTGTFTLVGIV